MCIPNEQCVLLIGNAPIGNEIKVPRGRVRAKLASYGLVGKVRLNTHMSEEEIFAEIRSVFSIPMGDNPDFKFEILQPAGGGSKTLIIPSRSRTFFWTAKQVILSSGRSNIYILAKDKLTMVKEEVCYNYVV